MGLREYKLDLHVHTCLSPCADLTMVPSAVMKEAREKHLDALGICDHNSAENVIAFKNAGLDYGVTIIGGMEITSGEEVHVLAYFEDDQALITMQERVYASLSGENDTAHFGDQLVVDKQDNFIESNDRLLIGATAMSLEEIVGLTADLGGISVASHIDRETFGIIGQLGFIPHGLPLTALEVSARFKGAGEQFTQRGKKLPLISSSDAHYLSDIGKSYTTFFMEDLSFNELKDAFAGIGGRYVRR